MAASLKFPSCLTAIAMDTLERFLVLGSIDGRIYVVDFALPPPTTAMEAGVPSQENDIMVTS